LRGYCPKCMEFRSDNGSDAWSIVWGESVPLCQRCKSVIDVWPNSNRGFSKTSMGRKKNRRKLVRTEKLSGNSFLSLETSPISEITTSTWAERVL